MKRKYFFRNLIFFCIPLLFPVLILGSFTIVLSQGDIKSNLEKNNFNLLIQTKENVDLILKELDSLSLNFDKDPKIVKRLKNILSANYLTMEDVNSLDFIKNSIETTTNSKPYIHSIYIYFERGRRNFLSSTQGLSNLDYSNDISWYQDYLALKTKHDFWSKKYQLKQNKFDPRKLSIISLSKKLYSPGSGTGDGVIVLNIIPEYVNHILKSLATLKNQSILVINESNKIIFQNTNFPYLNKINLNRLTAANQKFFTLTAGHRRYSISILHSDRYKWSYVSIVPFQSLYQPLYTLITITVFLLILSVGLGLVMAYYFTRKNYNQLERIFNLIDAAKSGKPFPPMPSKVHDEYEYILQNMLQTFIEQNYLQVQLSERKYKLQAMEFKALQSQINPHFLYNTLHTIYWEVLKLSGKPNKANLMLANLTDILKYSLSTPDELVSLAEEIKNTRSYIEIQQIRYHNIFNVIWEYQEEDLELKVVKLILQPLIENSINHGIRKKKNGHGCIKIKIRSDGKTLKITIIDNGIGINSKKLQQIKESLANEDEPSEHIGIYNTNKRLKLYYNQEYGLKILSNINRGTVIYIYIPIVPPTPL